MSKKLKLQYNYELRKYFVEFEWNRKSDGQLLKIITWADDLNEAVGKMILQYKEEFGIEIEVIE